MSRLTQIDLEHALRTVMMPLRPGTLTFPFYLASPRSDFSVRRSVPSTSSVPLFCVYLIRKNPRERIVATKRKQTHTLHEKQPSVEIILSSAGGI